MTTADIVSRNAKGCSALSRQCRICRYVHGGPFMRRLTIVVGSAWKILYECLEPTDTFLAFLPLAHILEFVVEMTFVFAGLPIGYGRVKTLTDASVRECKGDIAELKPVNLFF